MSDVIRPTYSSDIYNIYNSGQVRLYGIKGPDSTVKRDSGNPVPNATSAIDEDTLIAAISRKATSGLSVETLNTNVQRGFPSVTPGEASFVLLDSIIEGYTVLLGALGTFAIPEGMLSAGIIFGYAFEGHTYDLPKPKIMLIPASPEAIPADDSGYDKKPNYVVWIVDKLEKCIELEVNQGFIEQIVLEANLPGRRSPNMYAGRYQLGHRSGRLSE